MFVLVSTEREANSQLQERAVGVAIAELLLALLGKVGLEHFGSLGVVALQSADDAANLVGPLDGVLAVHVEGAGHFWYLSKRGGIGRRGVLRLREEKIGWSSAKYLSPFWRAKPFLFRTNESFPLLNRNLETGGVKDFFPPKIRMCV